MPKKTVRTPMRPSSRRKSDKPFKPPKFLRMLLILVIAVAGLYCVKATAVKILKPYVISYGESKEIDEIKKQIAVASAENRQIKRDISYVATPQGKEAEARKLGWVKKGEVTLVVDQPQQPKFTVEPSVAVKRTFWQNTSWRLVGMFVRTKTQ